MTNRLRREGFSEGFKLNSAVRPKILIVDDEPHIIRLLQLTLRKNFEVLTANTPSEAIYRARLENPHLILSDIQMPRMDGEQLCLELNKYRETKKIPFIFLTALSSPLDKISTLKTNAVDYVTKPFEPAMLIEKIKSNL